MSIGHKIKEMRSIKQLTRAELAERSGLDEMQVKKIEEDKYVPSLAPLMKIARAMGVRLGTFLDGQEQLGPVVVRGGEEKNTVSFISKNSGSRDHLNFFSLAHDKTGRNMEPFIVDIEPAGATNYKLSSHEGEEFIYVLEGEVEINYGKDIYTIKKGDSIYLDSVVLHNVHAGNNTPAKILAVIYAPA